MSTFAVLPKNDIEKISSVIHNLADLFYQKIQNPKTYIKKVVSGFHSSLEYTKLEPHGCALLSENSINTYSIRM